MFSKAKTNWAGVDSAADIFAGEFLIMTQWILCLISIQILCIAGQPFTQEEIENIDQTVQALLQCKNLPGRCEKYENVGRHRYLENILCLFFSFIWEGSVVYFGFMYQRLCTTIYESKVQDTKWLTFHLQGLSRIKQHVSHFLKVLVINKNWSW